MGSTLGRLKTSVRPAKGSCAVMCLWWGAINGEKLKMGWGDDDVGVNDGKGVVKPDSQ